MSATDTIFEETLAAIQRATVEAQRVRFRRGWWVPRRIRKRQRIKAAHALQSSLYAWKSARPKDTP